MLRAELWHACPTRNRLLIPLEDVRGVEDPSYDLLAERLADDKLDPKFADQRPL